MELERKTVFLYPQADEMNAEVYEETSKLISRIHKVVNISNELIKDILCGGSFPSVKCKPTVTMKCVGESLGNYTDYSNIRICVAKYNNFDYTPNYSKVIEAVKIDKTNISHLVALHIYSVPRPIKFYEDASNEFDAIVETDLDHLEKLLTTIMLDISLYHYFSLPSDLQFSRDFNRVKFDYIKNKYGHNIIKKIYGENVSVDKTIYLPFSMEKVNELNRRTKPDTKKQSIDKLIHEYGLFLINSISLKVVIDEHGYTDLASLREKAYILSLSDYIKRIRNEGSFNSCEKIIIVPENSTEIDPDVVLEYKSEETNIETWLSFLKTNTHEYDIILLTKKEK